MAALLWRMLGKEVEPELVDDWYQNKPGTNLVFDVQIPLFETGRGTVSFKSDAFFPVDGEGFADKLLGDDGKQHNFSFTTHVLRHFTYKKGQTFTFSGDATPGLSSMKP